MKEVQLLGVSKDTSSLIFDIVKETTKEPIFIFFPNIKDLIEPFTPIQTVNYKIMPLGIAPDSNNKVFFGAAGPKNKIAIFKSFKKEYSISENNYDKIVHSSAYIACSSYIEKGVLIEPHVVISSQSKIGFGVFVKRGSLIGHHNTIGAFTDINPGVIISGNVNIGTSCTIGSGSVIIDNISIGNNTIIGIGSVVTKNIPPNCIALGNPCKVIRVNE